MERTAFLGRVLSSALFVFFCAIFLMIAGGEGWASSSSGGKKKVGPVTVPGVAPGHSTFRASLSFRRPLTGEAFNREIARIDSLRNETDRIREAYRLIQNFQAHDGHLISFLRSNEAARFEFQPADRELARTLETFDRQILEALGKNDLTKAKQLLADREDAYRQWHAERLQGGENALIARDGNGHWSPRRGVGATEHFGEKGFFYGKGVHGKTEKISTGHVGKAVEAVEAPPNGAQARVDAFETLVWGHPIGNSTNPTASGMGWLAQRQGRIPEIFRVTLSGFLRRLTNEGRISAAETYFENVRRLFDRVDGWPNEAERNNFYTAAATIMRSPEGTGQHLADLGNMFGPELSPTARASALRGLHRLVTMHRGLESHFRHQDAEPAEGTPAHTEWLRRRDLFISERMQDWVELGAEFQTRAAENNGQNPVFEAWMQWGARPLARGEIPQHLRRLLEPLENASQRPGRGLGRTLCLCFRWMSSCPVPGR